VDPVPFLRFLARRAWLVLACALLGAGLAALLAAAQVPEYEGLTRVKVFPKRPSDFGQTQALQAILTSYTQDVPTVELARLAAGHLGLSPEEAIALRGRIAAEADPELYEVQVKARAGEPAEAERLSLAWALAFIDQRTAASRQLDPLDRIEATLRDDASHSQVAPRPRLWVAAGAALGLVLGLLLALGWEYLSLAPGAGAPGGTRREALTAGKVLARRAWPIAALALLGAVAAYAFSLTQTPTYRARTRIAVEPSRGSDWGQTQSIQETMRGYAADIATRRMAARVGEREELDLPADAVLAWANVAPDPATYEIHLDLLHPDPAVAASVSRAWAAAFIQEREQANLDLDQRDRTLVRLRDDTVTELWQPKKAPNALAGLALGALVGLGVVYLQWWLGRR
jgi:uncharacterized protein involved in exopolysaccharide biosynthesis